MDKKLADYERKLEEKKLESELAEQDRHIAESRAAARDMKAKHGKDWKKILGVVGSVRPNQEKMQDMLALGALREAGDPKNIRRFK